MSIVLPDAQRLSFTLRPSPVPSDMRISWRLSLLLLMLGDSRAKRASLAKLHVLNQAVRSPQARDKLERILATKEGFLNWQTRVEPALGRAMDYLVGENFARWVQVANRAGLQLTKEGVISWETLRQNSEVMGEEKTFLSHAAKALTEGIASTLVSERNSQ